MTKKTPPLSGKKKIFKKLDRTVKNMAKDMAALLSEHNSYYAKGGVAGWMESLPIETLSESINKDKLGPRTNLSLLDFKVKKDLRKKYLVKETEFNVLRHKRSEAQMDAILESIEKCLNLLSKDQNG